MFENIFKNIKYWLVAIDHLFGYTGSKLRKNRDIALLAVYIGWMSFFVLNFNKELVITALELPWMKNTTLFGHHLHQHEIHVIKDSIIDYSHYSVSVAFFICAFLCPLNPLHMLQGASFLIMVSGIFYAIPLWTHQNGLNYFCYERILLSVGCALTYSFGIGYLFGETRENAHHAQHHLLGSLIIADLIGEFCGMFLAYLVREKSWVYTLMGASLSVIIPLIVSLRWKFFKHYGQIAEEKKKRDNSLDDGSSDNSEIENYCKSYFFDLWTTFTKDGFLIRLLSCMLLLVASCVAGTVWEILGNKIYDYHHMTEKDISDVEVKAAFISCVFAIVSAATVAEGFDLGRKLCWFTIFNIILSLLVTGFFKNLFNLDEGDIEDVYIAHIIVNAGAREAAYEIIPNLFVNRRQVIAGWSLTLAAHYGIYQTMRVYQEEIWHFFERTIPLFWLLVVLQLFFFFFILCLYKWEKLSWMLEVPSRINVLTETSYLTRKVYLDVNEWTNIKTKLAMPNADLVVPAKKRITIEDVENLTKGTANKELNRELASALKKLTKTENDCVLLVHQESEPMKDLLIVDSLFNALSEKAMMKTAVIRAEFPIKIGSISKHLTRLDLLHPQSIIFYALGYDWLIHLIGVPHQIRLDKIPYIDQMGRKSSNASNAESENRSRASTFRNENPVTNTHVIHNFPMKISNFEKHVLISKKDDDLINEVSKWVMEEMVQIRVLIREKRDIRIMFITIPEIGDFNQVFKQFNELMKKRIFDEKSKDPNCSIEVLEWADMISRENKKRVETVDRRLRLLYENCELLQ